MTCVSSGTVNFIWTHYFFSPLRATALVRAKFLSIFQKKTKKPTFSILHTHFYKTFTSVCLFYHLFYLNNHFSHFLYIFFLFISNSLSLVTRHYLKLLSETPIQAWRKELRSKHNKKFFSLKLQSKPQCSPIHKRRSAISADLQALIHHKRQSTSTDPLSLSLLVCPCVGVFGFVVSVVDFWFLWLIFDFVPVGVRVSEEEEDNEGEKMRWFCRWRRERKKE